MPTSKEEMVADQIQDALSDPDFGIFAKGTVDWEKPAERGAWQTTQTITAKLPSGEKFRITVERIE